MAARPARPLLALLVVAGLLVAGCSASGGGEAAPDPTDVPTTEEATGHKWHKGVWRGFAAPKGLPPDIAKTYETAIKKAWDSDEFKEFMTRRGFDMIYLDAVKYGEFMTEVADIASRKPGRPWWPHKTRTSSTAAVQHSTIEPARRPVIGHEGRVKRATVSTTAVVTSNLTTGAGRAAAEVRISSSPSGIASSALRPDFTSLTRSPSPVTASPEAFARLLMKLAISEACEGAAAATLDNCCVLSSVRFCSTRGP